MSTMIRRSKQSVLLIGVLSLLLAPRLVAAVCLGDCNGNNEVSAGDVGKIIGTILRCGPCPGDIPGGIPGGCEAVLGGCPAADGSPMDGCIRAGELGKIIQNVLRTPGGCGVPVSSPTPTVAVPTATHTPSFTPVPPPTATATPTFTASFTPVPTPTATATTIVVAACGNGVVQPPEQCDDGGTCIGGPNEMMKCPATVSGGVDCGAGECKPFGGDGCALNCTTETTIAYEFTGAQCYGGAENGLRCSGASFCIGGAVPGRPCTKDTDCGPISNRGVCTSECAINAQGVATNDGSKCLGIGACASGPSAGQSCPSAISKEVPPPPLLLCQGGTRAGTACTVAADCTGGGSCINPCGSGNTCRPRSGAVLTSIGLIGTLGIGPLAGRQELHIGKADADGLIPVAIPATSVHFDPVRVPGLACACPRGLELATVHGPGNSGSGFIGCGAAGLADIDVFISQDHNITPGNAFNGPGTCSGGPRAGLACGSDGDCGTGGTCTGRRGGGGVCVGGSNQFKVCHSNADCPGSICNSPDDPTGNCTGQDPPPPAGSGRSSCFEDKQSCTGGPDPGKACLTDSECGSGGTCGVPCNTASPHLGICNSAPHLTVSGSGPTGSALLVTNTAIGVISLTDDSVAGVAGNCSTAGLCLPFNFNPPTSGSTAPRSCQVTSECTAPAVCRPAYCAGICTVGPTIGKPCIRFADCGTGGICTQGDATKFARECSGAPDSCGPTNVCVAVNPAKGFDGLPCTDDDPSRSRGLASNTPTTTGVAAAGVVDATEPVPSTNVGALITHGLCTDRGQCQTSLHGTPFNCAALLAGSVSGAQVVSAFTQLDATQIGDDVVTNSLTAK